MCASHSKQSLTIGSLLAKDCLNAIVKWLSAAITIWTIRHLIQNIAFSYQFSITGPILASWSAFSFFWENEGRDRVKLTSLFILSIWGLLCGFSLDIFLEGREGNLLLVVLLLCLVGIITGAIIACLRITFQKKDIEQNIS